MMAEQFNFNISLSVLNHLGRNLYRNFITVLGEAISNSWDAEAENIWIEIDDDSYYFSIKDDGIGMSGDDFQDKFLKIGYSKRKTGESLSPNKKRPYIGRKGIGKLALLSCAQRIHITSKTSDTDYIGGIIDNGALDAALIDDLNPEDCPLELLNEGIFEDLQRGHNHGTIIYFENTNDGVRNNIETLRRLIAMHFRFSLACKSDDSFSIYVNGTLVGFDDLKDLSENTEFLWVIDEFPDPFLETFNLKEKLNIPEPTKAIEGFIASVEKPSNLNIFGAGEKIGVDVFVNGRLRETNILKHTSVFKTRIVASYLYGQIHLNILDSEESKDIDRFTSSREGIKPGDEVYKELLQFIKDHILSSLSAQWDKWRIKHRQDGDSEETDNLSKSLRGLKSSKEALDKEVTKQIDDSENLRDSTKASLKETLLKLSYDNIQIYQNLFVLENLLRAFLKENGISNEGDLPTDKAFKVCLKKLGTIMESREEDERGHPLQDNIFEDPHVLDYFDLVCLGILTDIIEGNKTGRYKVQTMEAHLKDIMPIRNAIMHTNKVSDSVIDYNKIKSVIRLVDELRDKPKPTPNS